MTYVVSNFRIVTERDPKQLSPVACAGCGWAGTGLIAGRRHAAATGHPVEATESQTIRISAWEQRP